MTHDANALDAIVIDMMTPERHERKPLAESPWTGAGVLETAGGSIAYWTAGSGSPVLLVHGWEGTHDDLAAFARPFVESGRRVIAADLHAHGASSGTTASLTDLADTLLAIGAFTGPLEGVVAHSIGCAATGIALERGLHAARAVLISTPVRYERYVSGYAEHTGIPKATLVAAFAERGIDVRSFDLEITAAKLAVPALIMHSQDDTMTLIAGAEKVAAAWPGSTFRKVDGLGHMRILRDAATIEAAVDFVTGSPLQL